jgi:NAD(P)H-nitrite reductase large subunit
MRLVPTVPGTSMVMISMDMTVCRVVEDAILAFQCSGLNVQVVCRVPHENFYRVAVRTPVTPGCARHCSLDAKMSGGRVQVVLSEIRRHLP